MVGDREIASREVDECGEEPMAFRAENCERGGHGHGRIGERIGEHLDGAATIYSGTIAAFQLMGSDV
jgi:hypothetical protein